MSRQYDEHSEDALIRYVGSNRRVYGGPPSRVAFKHFEDCPAIPVDELRERLAIERRHDPDVRVSCASPPRRADVSSGLPDGRAEHSPVLYLDADTAARLRDLKARGIFPRACV